MNRIALSSLVLASAFTAGAHAGLVGFTGFDVESVGTYNGRDIYRVYANFSDATGYQFLNVYNHSITSGTMNALHNDFNSLSGGAGSWLPTFTSDSGALDGSFSDSFVTASGTFGVTSPGDTALDPSFGASASSIGLNGGWYDGNPATATTGLRLLILQVALAAGDTGYSADMQIGYKAVGTTTALAGSGSYTVGFVPAPGAIALLGLAGLAARRRR